ncbi:hypothetical protein CDAR_310851 [Caerostris darwini]|uniref:Uncharacterized protein n=1 Tax=Caerostris darwini TaxID=1538125 RepID=A0AAV4VPN3_9ARAC|nr:hypothetical protein CDAR_310851 [Caerostris darwini]
MHTGFAKLPPLQQNERTLGFLCWAIKARSTPCWPRSPTEKKNHVVKSTNCINWPVQYGSRRLPSHRGGFQRRGRNVLRGGGGTGKELVGSDPESSTWLVSFDVVIFTPLITFNGGLVAEDVLTAVRILQAFFLPFQHLYSQNFDIRGELLNIMCIIRPLSFVSAIDKDYYC